MNEEEVRCFDKHRNLGWSGPEDWHQGRKDFRVGWDMAILMGKGTRVSPSSTLQTTSCAQWPHSLN